MTTSTSRLSFSDCFEAFDKALADDYGVRIKLRSRDEAINLRMRMHTARSIDRTDNATIHQETPDHPLFGRSVYDALVLRIREDSEATWLYIERIALRGEVQALSSVGGWEALPVSPTPAIAPRPAQLQIEHVKRRV